MTEAQPPSRPPHPLRRVPLWCTAAVVLYAATVGLALPWLARPRLESMLTSALGRETRIASLRVNPFTLSATASGVEVDEEDGSPLLRCKEIHADLQIASLWQRAIVLRRFALVKPYLHLDVGPHHELNLASLPLFARPPGQRSTGVPPLAVEEVEIDGGDLLFTDRSRPTPFREELAPIHIQLQHFSTLADRSVPYALRATTADGDSFDWEGLLAFRPLRSEGHFHAVGTLPETAWRYLQDALHFRVGNASLEISTDYAIQSRQGGIAVTLDDGNLSLHNFSLSDRTSGRTVLRIPNVDVGGVTFDLATRRVTIASLSSRGGQVGILREKSGALELARLLRPKRSPAAPGRSGAANPPGQSRSSGFELRLGKLAIDGYTIVLDDQTTSPPAKLQAKDVSLHGEALSTAPGRREKLDLHLDLESGGRLQASGSVAPRPLGADLAISVDALKLRALQPYLRRVAKLRIEGGVLALKGRLALAAPAAPGSAGRSPRWRYRGRASLDGLQLSESGRDTELAGWQSLSLAGITLDIAPSSLRVSKVSWQKPVLHLRREPDGRIDTSWLVARKAGSGGTPEAPSREGSSIPVHVESLEVSGASATMTDDSVKPSVKSVLSGLDVALSGLTTTDSHASTLTLQGELDGEAPLSVKGQLGSPLTRAPTDLKVELSNYGLTSLSPYAARYIGQTIDQGKLSVDGTFRLSGSELDSESRLVFDQLALGDRVESPDAVQVPLGLAMALLRDDQGRLTLNLPVHGDISRPGFSYRGEFGRALLNVLRKVASSPFAVVGSLVGGGAELGYVDFAPGSDTLTADQARKVDALAQALKDRPGLILQVRGTASPSLDGPAEKAALLALAKRRGEVIRKRLLTDDGVAAERLFLLAPAERPAKGDATQARTELSLTTR